MIHELKILPFYFNAVLSGIKTFEIRKDDRNFKVNDEIILKEFCSEHYYEDKPEQHYTGRILHRKIVYKLKGEKIGLQKGYCILGIEKL